MLMAPLFLGGALLLAAVVLFLNWVVYRHAWATTHFVRHPLPEPAVPTFQDRLRLLLFGAVLPRMENRRTPADHGLAYETHEFAGGVGRLSAWYIPHSMRRGLENRQGRYAAQNSFAAAGAPET